MKQRVMLFAAVAAVGAALFVGVPALAATAGWSEFGKTGDSVTIGKDEIKNGSIYLAGNSVEMAGTVNGDVYAAGENIRITGTVNGDVLAAGLNVAVDGQVSGSVRTAAQNVNIGGKVGGSVSAFAQNAWLNSASTVGGDFNGGAATVNLDGTIGKNVRFAAETFNLNGKIGGVSDLSVGTISIGSAGVFGGDVFYEATTDQTVPKEKVSGDVYYNATPEGRADAQAASAIGAIFVWLMGVLVAVVTALVIALIAPNSLVRACRFARSNLAKAVLYGIAFIFAGPMFVIVLLMTVIGIPLAVIFLLLWIVVSMLSGVYAAYCLGEFIAHKYTHNVLLYTLVGAVVLSTLVLIPYINVLIVFATLVIGSGMLIGSTFEGRGPQHYKVGTDKKPAKLIAKKA